jgi:hypothetical protein
MKKDTELSPSQKSGIVNIVGLIILIILIFSYCWLPRGSLAYGILERLWRGMIASTAFTLIAVNFIHSIDWTTLGEWFEFNEDTAKAIVLAACILGIASVFIAG